MALFNAFAKMLQLSIFCVFILIIYGVFALKLLKGELYYCSGMEKSLMNEVVKTKLDCLDFGGSWVSQTLSYDNIFDSICVLFVTATTEAWLPILQ